MNHHIKVLDKAYALKTLLHLVTAAVGFLLRERLLVQLFYPSPIEIHAQDGILFFFFESTFTFLKVQDMRKFLFYL